MASLSSFCSKWTLFGSLVFFFHGKHDMIFTWFSKNTSLQRMIQAQKTPKLQSFMTALSLRWLHDIAGPISLLAVLWNCTMWTSNSAKENIDRVMRRWATEKSKCQVYGYAWKLKKKTSKMGERNLCIFRSIEKQMSSISHYPLCDVVVLLPSAHNARLWQPEWILTKQKLFLWKCEFYFSHFYFSRPSSVFSLVERIVKIEAEKY